MIDIPVDDGQASGAPSRQDGDVPPSSARPPSAGKSGGVEFTDPGALADETKAQLDKVLQSDIGVTTLLTRLKQSIASARDFAAFLKKRAALEEEHAQGLKKLSRSAHEAAHRIENRQGTYSQSYEELNRIHDRMADHGLQFAVSLQQMAEDLQELATNIERGRKYWKQAGLSAEKKVQDAENLAEKAKAKYDSLAEQYDRARTGDKQSGKFGLKGPKSAAQYEEDLHRKVQNADSDYAAKVQAAQAARQELVSTLRPQAVQNIHQLIMECDSGLALQLQKFATFNEKLLLGSGLCVSPLKNGQSNGTVGPKSLREVVQQVDNQKDFNDYVLSHLSNPGVMCSAEVKYERHPGRPPTQPGNTYQQSLPPLKPVFGVSLEDLYRRDGTAVPMIVYQCFQAVELFGLDVEGIYRLSGSANHINYMKSLFDNDSSQVDFTNPESFFHDVNSVAGLLKQFFRELPDPLFTSRYYSEFINAARLDDDIERRDSLHAIINNLPDPHYATLRALILHLNKVQEHYIHNRMNAGNLAICFGPTLMGANSGGNIADAVWQTRVIETILLNTFQIFDDD
ncbi:GTPase activating protein [Thermoascus aurantiacus ATCC 26904]